MFIEGICFGRGLCGNVHVIIGEEDQRVVFLVITMCSNTESEEICSINGISSSDGMTSKEELHQQNSDEDHHEILLMPTIFLQHSRIAEILQKLPLNEVRTSLLWTQIRQNRKDYNYTVEGREGRKEGYIKKDTVSRIET